MKKKRVRESIVNDTIRMHQDHEVQMARSQLYRAAKYAVELHDLLRNFSDTQDLEAWVQAKITMAAEQLESVKNYLEYEVISGEIPLQNGADHGMLPLDETTSSGSVAVSIPPVRKSKIIRRK